MNIPKLTLDTNLLLEYWKQQKKKEVIETLIGFAKQGKVDLVVTSRVREDIPRPPLSDKIKDLPELQINEIGSVARFGYWVLGRDMLADSNFVIFSHVASEIAKKNGQKPPDWRDWDHLHVYYLLKRDTFLTWDEGIIYLSKVLKDKFNISINKPDEYLNAFMTNDANQNS